MQEEFKSMQNEQNQGELTPVSTVDRFREMIKEKCSCRDCICENCQSPRMQRQKWTMKIAPNEYRLYDKFICKDCKIMHIKEIAVVDKNTDRTREILNRGQQTQEEKEFDKNWKKLGRDFSQPQEKG